MNTAKETTLKATLYTAIYGLQSEIGTISKTASNPFFKSKYADYAGIMETLQPLLTKYGLIVLQPVTEQGINTKVIHAETGDYVESHTPIICKEANNPQALGSAITYARRYGLSALLNLVTDEDDDGNAATGHRTNGKPVPQSNITTLKDKLKGDTKPNNGITAEQWADLQARCKAIGRNPLDILKVYGVTKGGDLPASAYAEQIVELN